MASPANRSGPKIPITELIGTPVSKAKTPVSKKVDNAVKATVTKLNTKEPETPIKKSVHSPSAKTPINKGAVPGRKPPPPPRPIKEWDTKRLEGLVTQLGIALPDSNIIQLVSSYIHHPSRKNLENAINKFVAEAHLLTLRKTIESDPQIAAIKQKISKELEALNEADYKKIQNLIHQLPAGINPLIASRAAANSEADEKVAAAKTEAHLKPHQMESHLEKWLDQLASHFSGPQYKERLQDIRNLLLSEVSSYSTVYAARHVHQQSLIYARDHAHLPEKNLKSLKETVDSYDRVIVKYKALLAEHLKKLEEIEKKVMSEMLAKLPVEIQPNP